MSKQSGKNSGRGKTVTREMVARGLTAAEKAAYDAIKDEDIVYDEDSPNMGDDDDFWANAVPWVPPASKEQISMRIDSDVLDWFKSHGDGKGYQQHINFALRSYMHQAKKSASKQTKAAKPVKKAGTKRAKSAAAKRVDK